MKSNDLKPGMAIDLDGQIWLVVKTEHVKPGKGPAFIQAKLKNLLSGANIEKRLRTSEDVQRVELDRREIEYLYSDNTGATFMDTENYEQTLVSPSVLGDALLYVKPNSPIIGLCHNANVVSIELPAAVDLEVTDTPPGIKNATATNQLKEAELETGLKTRVPPFINVGEIVRVSTESGEYQSRVTGR